MTTVIELFVGMLSLPRTREEYGAGGWSVWTSSVALLSAMQVVPELLCNYFSVSVSYLFVLLCF